ncbi:MAG: helix-turn-helix transcriptional regulator [Oscillospiraceae bacterium]|jgi:transcriptional regulator with XRE-family HTH domain
MFKISIDQFVQSILESVIMMQKYQRIRDLREDADLTQKQVGEAINVPQRTYAYYESGQRMVPPRVLCALADFYNVSVDYILGRVDEP